MKNNKTILLACCIAAANFFSLSATAQLKDYSAHYDSRSTAKQPTTLGNNPGGNPDVPVDGGISLLVLGGVALGAKKLYKKRNTAEATSK